MSSFVSVIVVVAVIAGCLWLVPAPGAAAGHQRATAPRQPARAGGGERRRARAVVALIGLVSVIGVLVAVAAALALVGLDALLQRAAGT